MTQQPVQPAAPARPKVWSEIDDAAPTVHGQDPDAPREYDDDDLVLHDEEAAVKPKQQPKLRTLHGSSEY